MKNQLKTILLLGILSSILVAAGAAISPSYAYGAFGLALLLNVGAYFFSDRIVLAMSRAREVAPNEAPELYEMVAELAGRAEIPMPRVFVIDDPQPNAFATGRNPKHGVVAVTTGITRLLTARELRGVLAHEISHIKNRDILVSSVAAVMASAISWLGQILSFAAFSGARDDEEGGSPVGGLVFALLAPIAAVLVQLGISRSREYLADESGARLAGDPEALARALEKLQYGADHVPGNASPATASLYIVNPLAGARGVMEWFSTHPLTEERVRRLRSLQFQGAQRMVRSPA
ncbi:MAG: zinc metalloprotease HtpX [Polyangiaceae bacterium]|nr:zinc metalloprotease HtpX [Polyangiaceae bacterium]